MISLTDLTFGPDARRRVEESADPAPGGAVAALETFYYAFNAPDLDALATVWSHHELAQLNNPVGGILRGGDRVVELYRGILGGRLNAVVTFSDVVEYLGADHAMFAGRELLEYTPPGGERTRLPIRTSRYFRYADGRWQLFHHHGSVDDPAALATYQQAVRG